MTCEAVYHLTGGRDSWTPQVMRWEGDTHWFLRHRSGLILDPTASQFRSPPGPDDYAKARGTGFLTKGPSRRAAALMDALVWQEDG